MKYLSLVIIILLMAGCAPKTAVKSTSGDIPISAPATVHAGDSIAVDVGPTDLPDGTSINLVTLDSFGPQAFQTQTKNGTAHFALSGNDSQVSGLVTLIATAGGARGITSVNILPGDPVEPVTPLIGGRSIIADGTHWSLVVGVPFDQFGNPVADGTPMIIRALHPGQHLEEKQLQVNHFLGWAKIFSGEQAGRTIISIQAGNAHGPEGDLNEVPGWPTDFTISAPDEKLAADGRQLIPVRTSILKDQFGNVIPDGTLVTFLVDAQQEGRRVIPAHTVGGVAEVPLEAASQPEVLDVWATLYGVESPHIQIGFAPGPAVGTFEMSATVDSKNLAIILEAGPMLGSLNQYIPDGTVVLFRLKDQTGQYQWLSGVSKAGHAEVEIRLSTLVAGTYPIDAWAGSGHGSTQLIIP